MAADMKEVRKRSWETRRKKYGQRGHSGAYGGFKPFYIASWNVRLRMMEDALIRLYRQAVLSEGQTCKATGMDRLTVREMAIQQAAREKEEAEGSILRTAETAPPQPPDDSLTPT